MTGTRLTPDQRQAIAEDIMNTFGTPAGSIGELVKRHGFSRGTIHRIKSELNLDGTEQIAELTLARENWSLIASARRRTASDRLSALALLLTDRAMVAIQGSAEERARMEAAGHIVPTRSGEVNSLMTAAARALEGHLRLEAFDTTDQQPAEVDRYIEHMLTGGEDASD